MSNDGEVERGIVFSGSAVVFIEDYVERPVEVVLDAPMHARGAEDGAGVGGERGDVEPRLHAFGLCLLVDAPCGDCREGAQIAHSG